eukprot:6399961-Prymnesium_polylepis.3
MQIIFPRVSSLYGSRFLGFESNKTHNKRLILDRSSLQPCRFDSSERFWACWMVNACVLTCLDDDQTRTPGALQQHDIF